MEAGGGNNKCRSAEATMAWGPASDPTLMFVCLFVCLLVGCLCFAFMLCACLFVSRLFMLCVYALRLFVC